MQGTRAGTTIRQVCCTSTVTTTLGGYHTSDLVTQNGKVNAGAKAAIDEAVGIMKEWVGDFKHGKHWMSG
jgi:hypothetical protein